MVKSRKSPYGVPAALDIPRSHVGIVIFAHGKEQSGSGKPEGPLGPF